MRRVFMTRHFSRWLGKTDLSIDMLCRAVEEMERGLIDARLGGGIVKKRVALPGRGKSGSARTLVATNLLDRWFFVFGFEKSDRGNINDIEVRALKALSADLLNLGASELSAAIAARTMLE
ncbi:MAG: type II toxin-antitoxin system RelE/ParE family toxin, partial [Candidatus Binatia bacterium]